MMNKISVIGRVSQDVTTNTINGRTVANFNVASNNKYKTGEENGRPVYGTNFYRVSAWGPAAETAAKFLKKGHRVGVTGDLVIRTYQTKDGREGTSVEINNAEIDLIETRAESEARSTTQAPVQQAAPAVAPRYVEPANMGDLPF